jgi:hypothetical protein
LPRFLILWIADVEAEMKRERASTARSLEEKLIVYRKHLLAGCDSLQGEAFDCITNEHELYGWLVLQQRDNTKDLTARDLPPVLPPAVTALYTNPNRTFQLGRIVDGKSVAPSVKAVQFRDRIAPPAPIDRLTHLENHIAWEKKREFEHPTRTRQREGLQEMAGDSEFLLGFAKSEPLVCVALNDVIWRAKKAESEIPNQKGQAKFYPQVVIGKVNDFWALVVQVNIHQTTGRWPSNRSTAAFQAGDQPLLPNAQHPVGNRRLVARAAGVRGVSHSRWGRAERRFPALEAVESGWLGVHPAAQ